MNWEVRRIQISEAETATEIDDEWEPFAVEPMDTLLQYGCVWVRRRRLPLPTKPLSGGILTAREMAARQRDLVERQQQGIKT